MSDKTKHIIRKTSLELNYNSRADGFLLHEEVHAWANGYLLPKMNQVFDALPPREDHIIIDKIDIEINSSDLKNWGEEAINKLRAELESILISKVSQARTASPDKKISPAQSFYNSLSWFLRHGVLPWNATINSQSEWEEQMSLWLSSPQASESLPDFKRILSQASAQFRFVQSFPLLILQKAFSLLFAAPEDRWKKWLNETEKIIPLSFSLREDKAKLQTETPRQQKLFLIHLLDALSENAFVFSSQTEEQAAENFLRQFIIEQKLNTGKAPKIVFETNPFINSYKNLAEDKSLFPDNEFSVTSDKNLSDTINIPAGIRRSIENISYENGSKKYSSEHPVKEGIFISNAGLVIVTPFLSRFFEAVDISKGDKIQDQAMAVLLLHYLSCGKEQAAEFQLALPKILCGMEIEEPLALPDAIPESMKEEAAKLLSSVIEHWDALKNTSVQGLQESFLQRSGKLSLSDRNEWLLQTEQKAYDILLQRLPWTINMIKLSWMKRMLKTEWV